MSSALATGSSASRGDDEPCASSIASSDSALGYPMEMRAVNLSRCASGRGYVPSISMGFWVAMTMKGGARG
jgi:hypothetical protein